MADVSFKNVRNDVDKRLTELAKSRNYFDAWAAKTLPVLYSNAMRAQFMSEGASEGKSWSAPSNKRYIAWKTKNFKGWPGGGTKTQIASSRLLASSLPPTQLGDLAMGSIPPGTRAKYWTEMASKWGNEFRAIIPGGGSVIYTTTLPYSLYANQRNNYRNFSETTRTSFALSYRRYFVAATKTAAGVQDVAGPS